MNALLPNVAILGASGLIGQAIATELRRAGFSIIPVARRFTAAQQNAFAGTAVECPIAALDEHALARLLVERQVDVIVNCLGVLQDSGRERTDDVHRRFVTRLVGTLGAQPETPLLIHLSIPGNEVEDGTEFSQTKRKAEHVIRTASVPFVILRPGFVIANTVYGGSALIRAMAALPLGLPSVESERPFAATNMADITQTVIQIVRRWRGGERQWAAVWDVMERHPSTVGGVIDGFRRWLGGPRVIGRLPAGLMVLGAKAGDLSAHLGWRPPIRSTALREMRRGVVGHPEAWIAATGIEPTSLEETLAQLPATVQEKWFARLYLAKAAILGSLVVFWSVSGFIALTLAYQSAAAILTDHGIPPKLAGAITILTSLSDICVGAAIAVRKTCRRGLLAGIAISLGYMAGAVLVAPELWIEPLGALVKTGPAIILMLVGLAILDDR
ncbi:MAG: hypothetical protein QOJ54_2553 [Aliidongia sp.]|jgi:uncharacterized protein YbjT (DUF2867 family)|nr:hypothetical protein [Aliidongia sp.]